MYFKTLGLICCFLLVACSSDRPAKDSEPDPLTYVDPFIGTDGKGKTFPGATVPHGMVQLSPDNGRSGWDWIAGYFYPDNIIAGFSHTHLSGTGAGDLYDISFMPLSRPFHYEKTEGGPQAGTLVSRFSHHKEQASPGYYQVYLEDYKVNVELTAGLRTGFQRYQFDKGSDEGLVRLDLAYSRNWDATVASHIDIINEHSIGGYRLSTGWAKDQRVYFYSEFSLPIKHATLSPTTKSSVEDKQHISSGEFSFALDDTKFVTVRTAISSISVENARQNLVAEGENKSFNQVLEEAKNAWRTELSKVDVQASEDNTRQFYTAMYHAALAPRIYSDSDGRYKGPDGKSHHSTPYPRYELFSLWDTFRALHPWLTIIAPARTTQMMYSILAHEQVSGRLPVWIFQGNETDMMMGYHSVPVLVDAYQKGLLEMDGEQLLTTVLKSANQSDFGLTSYQNLGYVPYEEGKWNVSLTLEYAYDDWAIAQLAKTLGNEDIYQQFIQRSQNYRRHFDPISGFMRAKDKQGEYRLPFDPHSYQPEDYCEANAWQYSFFVPQDVPGLIALMGGPDKFSDKLDQMFKAEQNNQNLPEWISGYIGQYVHGNEPSHHVPYLYQYVNQGYKTQALVRQIMDELYTTSADGLAGNEDAGQMSAWYLFSALGFYPVDPVSGRYILGSPEVSSATIKLENGNSFQVKTTHQSPINVYVKQVYLNGEKLERNYITHQEIVAGGELRFEMSPKP
jgi:predicted alpha-1,2-mannosidase